MPYQNDKNLRFTEKRKGDTQKSTSHNQGLKKRFRSQISTFLGIAL